MSFEKAYSYYRQKKDQAALNVLAKMDKDEARVMELKAQLFYRLERFEEALQLFTKLMRTHSDEYDELRRCNVIAVKARLEAQGVRQEAEHQDGLDTFEQMYNASCQLLAAGKFQEAANLLDKTLAVCRKTLVEDGLTEVEIQSEIAPILAQKAYALQKLGSLKEALKLYEEVLKKTKSLNFTLRATILENLEADYVKYGQNYRPRKETAEVPAANLKSKTIKKRKRKSKKPTTYDPEVPPDPERWLPKQERMAYKKKLNKRFKDRDIGRGTQGAAGTSSANIDYSKAPSAEPHPSPKPTPPAPEGPRQQRPTQKAKATKKKKGGKW